MVPQQDQTGVRIAAVVQGRESPKTILQFLSRHEWLGGNEPSAFRSVAALISRDLLQSTLKSFMPTFDMRVVSRMHTAAQQ